MRSETCGEHIPEAPVSTCGGIVAWNSSMALLGIGATALLHKTGHHRIERWSNWIIFAGSAYAVATLATYNPRLIVKGLFPGQTATPATAKAVSLVVDL